MPVLRKASFLLAIAVGILASVTRGQDAGSARERYLTERGLRGAAADIESYLSDELQAMGYENARGMGEFFSFIMVLHGLNLDKVMRLQSGGIDIIHAMTSDARPFIEQGLFSDPAVTAEVLAYADSDTAGDGYSSSVVLKVLDRLKGRATPDTIYLRQRRLFSEGMGPRDMIPEVGERYLLLLSRPMYEFAVWRRAGSAQISSPPPLDHYAIYRYYRTDDKRVVMGDGSSYDAGSVYQELRWLQELIEKL